MKKLIVISVFALLLLSSLTFYNYSDEVFEKGETINMEDEIYQGPVPLGYDLEHFRKTGETIKEVSD